MTIHALLDDTHATGRHATQTLKDDTCPRGQHTPYMTIHALLDDTHATGRHALQDETCHSERNMPYRIINAQ